MTIDEKTKIESIGLFHGVNKDTLFSGPKWTIWPD